MGNEMQGREERNKKDAGRVYLELTGDTEITQFSDRHTSQYIFHHSSTSLLFI